MSRARNPHKQMLCMHPNSPPHRDRPCSLFRLTEPYLFWAAIFLAFRTIIDHVSCCDFFVLVNLACFAQQEIMPGKWS